MKGGIWILDADGHALDNDAVYGQYLEAPYSERGRFIYNPGPETRIVAEMALIVLGETESVHKLRRSIGRGFDAPSA